MRSTITIDDDLFDKACQEAGDTNVSSVVTAALKQYVQSAAAKRLLLLGGSTPDFTVPGYSGDARGDRLVPFPDSSKVAEDEIPYNT